MVRWGENPLKSERNPNDVPYEVTFDQHQEPVYTFDNIAGFVHSYKIMKIKPPKDLDGLNAFIARLGKSGITLDFYPVKSSHGFYS